MSSPQENNEEFRVKEITDVQDSWAIVEKDKTGKETTKRVFEFNGNQYYIYISYDTFIEVINMIEVINKIDPKNDDNTYPKIVALIFVALFECVEEDGGIEEDVFIQKLFWLSTFKPDKLVDIVGKVRPIDIWSDSSKSMKSLVILKDERCRTLIESYFMRMRTDESYNPPLVVFKLFENFTSEQPLVESSYDSVGKIFALGMKAELLNYMFKNPIPKPDENPDVHVNVMTKMFIFLQYVAVSIAYKHLEMNERIYMKEIRNICCMFIATTITDIFDKFNGKNITKKQLLDYFLQSTNVGLLLQVVGEFTIKKDLSSSDQSGFFERVKSEMPICKRLIALAIYQAQQIKDPNNLVDITKSGVAISVREMIRDMNSSVSEYLSGKYFSRTSAVWDKDGTTLSITLKSTTHTILELGNTEMKTIEQTQSQLNTSSPWYEVLLRYYGGVNSPSLPRYAYYIYALKLIDCKILTEEALYGYRNTSIESIGLEWDTITYESKDVDLFGYTKSTKPIFVQTIGKGSANVNVWNVKHLSEETVHDISKIQLTNYVRNGMYLGFTPQSLFGNIISPDVSIGFIQGLSRIPGQHESVDFSSTFIDGILKDHFSKIVMADFNKKFVVKH